MKLADKKPSQKGSFALPVLTVSKDDPEHFSEISEALNHVTGNS